MISWFSSPKAIHAVNNLGYDVIGMIKKTPKMHFIYEDEIIRIYGKRWQIAVFFKEYKSYLRLSKECKSLSYDAMTAHVAIVFT